MVIFYKIKLSIDIFKEKMYNGYVKYKYKEVRKVEV